MNEMAKILIFAGGIFILAGVVLLALEKIPGIGKLPGDIIIKRENFTFYFPLATSILLSVILSLVFYFINRR